VGACRWEKFALARAPSAGRAWHKRVGSRGRLPVQSGLSTCCSGWRYSSCPSWGSCSPPQRARRQLLKVRGIALPNGRSEVDASQEIGHRRSFGGDLKSGGTRLNPTR
jgi:hypothetical protein